MPRPAILTLSLALLGACASKTPIVPPVSPEETGVHHIGKFVWYDLITDDVAAARQFYGALFGWEFRDDDGDERYITIVHRGRQIGGIAHVEPVEQQHDISQWVSWLSVPDVGAAVELVQQAGGEVHREPKDLPNRGRFALVSDPQGALVALLRSTGGDPPDAREVIEGAWLWTELWTHDVESAVAFYRDLAGYEREITDTGLQQPYHVLMRDDRARGGVARLSREEVRPNWLPYILVDRPGDLLPRVDALGGRVVFAPDSDVRSGTVAVIQDPTGAVLAIQKWPLEEEGGTGR
jgi:predicted enzyme related to lactoylglutathione lyase